MLRLSGLRGIIATGLLLLWAPVAIAQSSGAINESRTTSPAAAPVRHPPGVNSLICDSSGKVCIAAQNGGIGRSSSPLHMPATRGSMARPSIAGTPPQVPAHKQQAKAPATLWLVCDASGNTCTPASAPQASQAVFSHAPSRQAPGIASARIPSPMTHSVGKGSSKADGIKPQIKEVESVDNSSHIRIDGVGAYYDGRAGSLSANPFDWVVHAYKSQHRLEVDFRGRRYRSYHAVFGRSPVTGAKVWEGDRRTPEGNYLIVGKHRSARYGWFLHISYPNERDHQRFELSRAAHLIPASANEGGEIGIHGTDSPYLNVADIDWTTGCISVDNTDIEEMTRLLPIGTLVIINP
jgi:lipoprotein-anchoring transpeptidase ErfK/SrfK